MKSRIVGRKQILTFSLVAALGLAMFVNWYYTKPQGNMMDPETTSRANLGDAQYVNSTVKNEDYFESAEINRTKARDTAKEYLNSILNDSNVDDETKVSARKKLTEISEYIKTESDIEALITAQTKNKCLVTYDGETIEIILPKGTVNDTLIVKIKDLIISKTSLSSNKITIIETK